MNKDKIYDVAIIGGGVTGTSTLYLLSKYTNIESAVLLDKHSEIAQGVSNKNNNSQTLHFGDIETNYTPEKAKKVKEAAEMIVNYVNSHEDEGLYRKKHKMVLAVGEDEVEELEERFESFKEIFPKLKKAYRDEIAEIEPNLVKDRNPDTPLMALVSPNGYIMNYGNLSKSFVEEALKSDKDINLKLNTKIKSIGRNNDLYEIKNDNKSILAKTVLVAAGGYSLKFAYQLDYCKDWIVLPVSGNFFCSESFVSGKVYMMQMEGIPFAAIHADPDVENPGETRFGPVSKVLPMLEKRRLGSIIDFFQMFKFRLDAILALLNIISNPIYLRYVLKQVLYSLPVVGKAFYLKEARKIIPSINYSDIKIGKGIGGIRPQVVDVKNKELMLGEAKIEGDNIIFDITPSPGASVCLKNAEKNTNKLIEFLGDNFYFNKGSLSKDLKKSID